MAAVANNPKFAKKVGIPQSVGEDYVKADKGRKFNRGGEMKESKEMMKKEVAFMKKKGAPKSMLKHEKAEAGMEAGGVAKKLPTAKQMGDMGMKKGGKVKCMAGGGYVRAADGVAKKGKTRAMQVKMKGAK